MATPVLARASTVEALLRAGVRLLEAGSRSPRLDAEILLAHALGWERARLFTGRESAVADAVAGRYLAAIHARQAGQPVAQLVGSRAFWTFDLAITPDVLIPRPETELLVERALARLPAGTARRVLDLGTGSGAVALAIASERPACAVTATDRSLAALEVARRNAETLGLTAVRFAAGDWFAAVAGQRFDLIAANPPYVADDEWHSADPELSFEPREALAAGTDGLAALRTIVAGAGAHLGQGGWLAVEHGAGQGAALRRLLAGHGFVEVATAPDLAGHPRVTEGRRPD